MQKSETASQQDQVYVWDPFVRIFHWSVVIAFTVAYFVEKPLIVHVWAGYVIGILIVARLIWGFFGPSHARFSDSLTVRLRAYVTCAISLGFMRNAISVTVQAVRQWCLLSSSSSPQLW